MRGITQRPTMSPRRGPASPGPVQGEESKVASGSDSVRSCLSTTRGQGTGPWWHQWAGGHAHTLKGPAWGPRTGPLQGGEEGRPRGAGRSTPGARIRQALRCSGGARPHAAGTAGDVQGPVARNTELTLSGRAGPRRSRNWFPERVGGANGRGPQRREGAERRAASGQRARRSPQAVVAS